MGDLNIDLLSDDSHSRELQSLISSYACINYITLPTRITCNTDTLLDICISNVQLPHTELSLDIIGHLPIFCFIPLRINRVTNTVTHMTRDFNDVALNEFRKLIEHTNWESVFFLFEYIAGPSRPVQEWYRNVLIKTSWGKADTENVIQKSYRNVMKKIMVRSQYTECG